jgi:hypothetical protein
MLDALRSRWRADFSFDELVKLRDELDAMLHRIRSERHVRSPVIKCPRCGQVGEAAEPVVTVRAMILSLARFGIAPAEQVQMLEKSWAAHRELKRLDLCGRPAKPRTTNAGPCGHANFR